MRKSESKNREGKRARQGKRLAKLKKACLAAGLATAWGGEAKAEREFNVSITPTRTITNAWVYYHQNATSNRILRLLGTLPANQASSFSHRDPERGLPDSEWFDTTRFNPGYVVMGLYDDDGQPGVAVSMPNDDAITAGLTWEQFFATPDPSFEYSRYYSEAEVIAALQGDHDVLYKFLPSYAEYFHADPPPGHSTQQLVTHFGEPATLVGFSTAPFLGTAHATVPEPSSMLLVVCSIGVLGVAARMNRCLTIDRG